MSSRLLNVASYPIRNQNHLHTMLHIAANSTTSDQISFSFRLHEEENRRFAAEFFVFSNENCLDKADFRIQNNLKIK